MRGPFERRMSDVGVTSGLSPQMAGRPLHSGSSQGELRHKMMIPPELPLRRGASVDRVVDLPPPPNGATTLNSKSSSTATSRNYICFYLSIFWNYDYYFSKKKTLLSFMDSRVWNQWWYSSTSRVNQTENLLSRCWYIFHHQMRRNHHGRGILLLWSTSLMNFYRTLMGFCYYYFNCCSFRVARAPESASFVL